VLIRETSAEGLRLIASEELAALSQVSMLLSGVPRKIYPPLDLVRAYSRSCRSESHCYHAKIFHSPQCPPPPPPLPPPPVCVKNFAIAPNFCSTIVFRTLTVRRTAE